MWPHAVPIPLACDSRVRQEFSSDPQDKRPTFNAQRPTRNATSNVGMVGRDRRARRNEADGPAVRPYLLLRSICLSETVAPLCASTTVVCAAGGA